MIARMAPVELLVSIAMILAVVVPGGVTLLKGRYVLFAVGLLLSGFVWWITALRLAEPSSWWARRMYDDEKLARARDRFAPKVEARGD